MTFLAVEASATAARPGELAVWTLRRSRASIRLMHLAQRLASSHTAPEVAEHLRGVADVRRDVATRRKVSAPDGVCRMVDALDTDSLAGLRDAALLLGIAVALRCSELVGLDVEDLERPEVDLELPVPT